MSHVWDIPSKPESRRKTRPWSAKIPKKQETDRARPGAACKRCEHDKAHTSKIQESLIMWILPVRTFRWQKVGIMSRTNGLLKCTAAQFCEKQGLKSMGRVKSVKCLWMRHSHHLTSSHIGKREAEEGDADIPVLGFSSGGRSWLPDCAMASKEQYGSMAYGGSLEWGYPQLIFFIGFPIMNNPPLYGNLMKPPYPWHIIWSNQHVIASAASMRISPSSSAWPMRRIQNGPKPYEPFCTQYCISSII